MQAEIIHALGEQIGTKLAKAEELGAEGNVEESLKFMEEVEELKKKKAAAEVSSFYLVCLKEIIMSLHVSLVCRSMITCIMIFR